MEYTSRELGARKGWAPVLCIQAPGRAGGESFLYPVAVTCWITTLLCEQWEQNNKTDIPTEQNPFPLWWKGVQIQLKMLNKSIAFQTRHCHLHL